MKKFITLVDNNDIVTFKIFEETINKFNIKNVSKKESNANKKLMEIEFESIDLYNKFVTEIISKGINFKVDKP